MLSTETPGLTRAYYDRTFQGCFSPDLILRVGKWTGDADGRDKICKFVRAVLKVMVKCSAPGQLVTYSEELITGVQALREGNSLFNSPAKAGYLYMSLNSGYEMLKGSYDYGERSNVEKNVHRLYILAGTISLSAFMVMFAAYRPISVFKKFTSIPYFPAVTPNAAMRGFMMAATVNHVATVIQHGAVVGEAYTQYVREAEGADEAKLKALGYKYYEKVAPAYAKMIEKMGDLVRDIIFFDMLETLTRGFIVPGWWLKSGLLVGTATLSAWGTWSKTFDAKAAAVARAA